MNAIADKLLALFALGSIFALPLLIVAWFLFPKKRRREAKPETGVSVAVAKSSMSVFIVED